MPNGKGELDCRYCVYARRNDGEWPVLVGSSIRCLFHEQELPVGEEPYRFCTHFKTNDFWYSEQYGMHELFPMFHQIARLGAELEPGMLYSYVPGIPDSLGPLKRLRIPDFKERIWRKCDESESNDIDGEH